MERNCAKVKVVFYSPTCGGRSVVPINDGYAPYLRTACFAEDLAIRLNSMPSSGNFDTEYEAELELKCHPLIDHSPLTKGTRFLLIEGPRVVGEGVLASAIYQSETSHANTADGLPQTDS
jgi:hypothetical protein